MENEFNKDDIEEILRYSKPENKQYLNNILSIKNISVFDANYIMNNISLTSGKIELIKLALKRYETMDKLKEKETYSDFLYRIVRSIEKLDNENINMLNEIVDYRKKVNNISSFVDYFILKSCSFLNEKPAKEFAFSSVNINNFK